jgi:protein-tyrosine phosphatase
VLAGSLIAATPRYALAIEILFVCTANICRSPMAEALLRARLAARGIAAGVASAGLLQDGREVAPEVVALMAERGLDVAGRTSRHVEPADVEASDLVLGMQRLHVREIVLAQPDTWPRTLALKELVRLGEQVGARPTDESVEDWLARTHEKRDRSQLLSESVIDDIADPYGGPVEGYRVTAEEIDEQLASLVGLIWPGGT